MATETLPAWLARTSAFLTSEQMSILRNAHILVVGLGGVGGIAVELIARAGVGQMTVIDGDSIEASNINRQIPALHSTIGLPKTEAMAARIRDINPDIALHTVQEYLDTENIHILFESQHFTAVLDAIDSLVPKVELLASAVRAGIPVVSSMGAGLRFDPGAIRVDDISKTHTCPLAKNVRRELRVIGINSGVRAVFSTEVPGKPVPDADGHPQIATISYMPAAFGVRCAAELLQILIAQADTENV